MPRPRVLAINPVSELVPISGGQVVTAGGSLLVQVPPDAYLGPLLIAILPTPEPRLDVTPTPPPSLSPFLQVGSTVFHVVAQDALDGSQVMAFEQGLTVRVQPPADDLALLAQDGELVLGYVDEVTGAWVELPTRVEPDGTLAAVIDHPAQIGVLRRAPFFWGALLHDAECWSGMDTDAISFGPLPSLTDLVVSARQENRYFATDFVGGVCWVDVEAVRPTPL